MTAIDKIINIPVVATNVQGPQHNHCKKTSPLKPLLAFHSLTGYEATTSFPGKGKLCKGVYVKTYIYIYINIYMYI